MDYLNFGMDKLGNNTIGCEDFSFPKSSDINFLMNDSKYFFPHIFSLPKHNFWGNIDIPRVERSFSDDLSLVYWGKKKEKIYHPITLDSTLIDILSQKFQNLTRNFDDLRLRQIYFSEIKDKISELWSMRREEGYYGELLIFINQAIEGIRSENSNEEKIAAFEDALSILKRGGITEDDIVTITKKFIKCGIPFVSPIPELSKLYED